MTNNSAGSRQFMVTESTEAMMRAYDSMPRILRDVYKYVVGDFALARRAKEITLAIDDGTHTAHSAARVVFKNLTDHDAEECYRTYGPDHPQSDNHGRRLRPNQIAIWGNARG